MHACHRRAILVLAAALAGFCFACEEERPPPQYPPQPYPQQYPPQPYPQQHPQPQPYPQPQPAPVPAPTTTAPAPAPTSTSAIPGVVKNPDGTCSITPPALGGGEPPQPIQIPCPPGM
jgi:hypothetical protein